MGRVSGGLVFVPGAVNALMTGAWYPSDNNATVSNVLVDGNAYAMPFISARPHTYQGMAFSINTAGTAGATGHLGIYADSNGYPGALLQDLGSVATTGTGSAIITTPIFLNGGQLVWLVLVPQGAPVTQAKIVQYNGSTALLMGQGAPAGNTESWVIAGVGDGALPNPMTGGGALTAHCPQLYLQA